MALLIDRFSLLRLPRANNAHSASDEGEADGQSATPLRLAPTLLQVHLFSLVEGRDYRGHQACKHRALYLLSGSDPAANQISTQL